MTRQFPVDMRLFFALLAWKDLSTSQSAQIILYRNKLDWSRRLILP